MPVHNSDVADMLEEIADLLAVEQADQFRIRAYRNAAQTVRSLSRDVSDMVDDDEDLTELSGIGQSIADKIHEIVETGSLDQLDKLESEVPVELRRVMHVEGLGPKRTHQLYEELGIKTLDDLQEAANAHRIQELEGFGEKLEQKILDHVEAARQGEQRTLLTVADERAEDFVELLEGIDTVDKVVVAGSYRRRKETVGDLDILVTCEDNQKVMDAFVGYEDVDEVVSRGDTRSTVIVRGDFQIDLRVVQKDQYGAALHYFTGSKSHNIACRQRGIDRGLKINEYGVFEQDSDERVGGQTEEEVYELIDMAYVEPELRENRGEIEAAVDRELPELITLDDLRGDLHCHTTASDGRNEIEEMAEAARERGYEYLVITDHSQAVGVAGGLDADELREHMANIDEVAERYDDFKLLKGCEVDILEDGSLDLPDDVLAELDYVVCSVHSAFDLSADAQTERIISAMQNPHMMVLGHPTGRLIGERQAYDLHMDQLLEAAKDNGVVMELDSQPDRLDLNDIYCKQAKELGVKIAIASDAHSTDQLSYVERGIFQARRGWLSADDVINTRSWKELKKLLER